jgi:serine/threonine protein kinase
MKQPNWNRIQEIYHAALARPHSERSVFVANACSGDLDLQREVNSLLQADDSAGGFLESPVVDLGSSPENLVGATIGERYFVERELTAGGMSHVYFALDLRLQRQAVVIKILSHSLIQDPYARQKFEQEVEALLRTDHPNVVRILDTGKLTDGRPYIVMQYVDGETLRSRITNDGIELKLAASILKQIGAALEHVHGKGIFHRDLKPENIRLKGDSVVLVDFGIAKVKDSLIAATTAGGVSVGTLAYMSPEQLRGEEITAASDIYSMALIAYEIVTGRRPFKPGSASHLLDLQRAGVRVRPKHLREDLSTKADSVLLRALKFEPKGRYKSASEFGEKLAHALLEPRKTAIPKWAKVAGSLIILVLLSFGVFKYLRRTGAPEPNRSFTYWLTVQRMRDGKDYQEPLKSNGEEVFENGDKFRLNVLTPIPGYLYVMNEGPPEPKDTSFTMIYPSLNINEGSATLGANQSIQSDWITFRGLAGDENFWIVWSVSPVSQLESAKTEALKDPHGGLTDRNLEAVKEFLRRKQLEMKVTVYHYKATQTAVARGKGDMLVTLLQFKHR